MWPRCPGQSGDITSVIDRRRRPARRNARGFLDQSVLFSALWEHSELFHKEEGVQKTLLQARAPEDKSRKSAKLDRSRPHAPLDGLMPGDGAQKSEEDIAQGTVTEGREREDKGLLASSLFLAVTELLFRT